MSLDQQIQSAQERLQQIQHQAEGNTGNSPLLATAITELAVALEELHAATEELHLQNEELLATHQTLAEERQRYQNLFDFAPDAYIVTNLQGVIEAVNGAAEKLLNIRRDVAQDKPLIVFIAEADHNFIYEQLDRVVRWGQHQTARALAQDLQRQNLARSANILLQDHEIFIQPRDGIAVTVSLALSAEFNYQGEPVGLHWLLRDLRDRKQAEQKIRTQATLLNLVPNAIFAFDLNHQIIYWNQGASQLYGWSATEVMGQSVDSLVYQNVAQLAQIKTTLLEKGKWQGEVCRILSEGQKVTLEARYILVRINAGQSQAILAVETNITEKNN
ncbi:MAG: PAS domain S-box protein [Leptolyngbyaceae cyanobacterium SM2_5_2]|nr:PAS domain S-box protein [Leptolyngbyaceae cyanobacterium SM2_5_2]